MTTKLRVTTLTLLAVTLAALALCLGTAPAFADGQQIKLRITPVGADGSFFPVSAKPGETTQLVVQLGNPPPYFAG